MDATNLSDPGSPNDELRSRGTSTTPGASTKDQEKVMANLKDIVATLAILSAGTLTLTGCKKEGETANPDEVKAGDTAAPAEGSCEGEKAEGEASCEGEGSCEGDKAEGGEADAPAEEAPAEEAPAL
jgi:hypothetical protein